MGSVIFDLDGTLVQTVEMTAGVIQGFRRETRENLLCLGIPEEVLSGVDASTLMRNRANQYAEANMSESERLRLKCGMNQFLLRHELRWASRSALFPDTLTVLKIIKEHGRSMAIVTNTSRQAAEVVFARHRLSRYFAAVITRDDVTQLKPDPEGVLLAVKSIGERAACFVGDSPVDVAAARGAGVKSIIIDRGYSPELFPSGFQADHRVRSLLEILSIVSRDKTG
jgi:HAD superfamily hydrolase (TIGR01549 family)